MAIKQSTVGRRQTVEKLHIQGYGLPYDMTKLRLPERKRSVFLMLPPIVCYIICTCYRKLYTYLQNCLLTWRFSSVVVNYIGLMTSDHRIK